MGCQVFPGGAVIHLPQQQTPTSTWCWRAQLGVACERVRKNIKASKAIERGHCDHEKSKKQKKKEEKGKSGLATEAKERGHCDQGKSKEKKREMKKEKVDGPQGPKSGATAAGQKAGHVRELGLGGHCRFGLQVDQGHVSSKFVLDLMGYLSHGLFHYVATWVFAAQKT